MTEWQVGGMWLAVFALIFVRFKDPHNQPPILRLSDFAALALIAALLFNDIVV